MVGTPLTVFVAVSLAGKGSPKRSDATITLGPAAITKGVTKV